MNSCVVKAQVRMTNVSVKNGYEIYTVVAEDGRTKASFIPEKGGVGCSLIMPVAEQDQELLFLHDYFWQRNLKDLGGGWPFLFPVCARLEYGGTLGAYRYEDQIYQMPIHGFAPYLSWTVVDSRADSLTMCLTDNDTTRAMYPFSFYVELTYRVLPNQLICEQTYRNTGDAAMPYYAGFHPYFLTPLPRKGKEQVILNYAPKRRFLYNERMTGLVGEQPLFALPAAITEDYLNEQLTQVDQDNIVQLSYPNGLQVSLCAQGVDDKKLFSYIQIYTISDKPFFCIEPWMGVPNALNTMTGVRWLKPNMEEKAILKLFTHHLAP